MESERQMDICGLVKKIISKIKSDKHLKKCGVFRKESINSLLLKSKKLYKCFSQSTAKKINS